MMSSGETGGMDIPPNPRASSEIPISQILIKISFWSVPRINIAAVKFADPISRPDQKLRLY